MSLKALSRLASLMFGLSFVGAVCAQHEGPADEQGSGAGHEQVEKFNAGKMILEHIADEHGWHLWGHTSIPLPVILYDAERGLKVFSSARFEHGHASHDGYALSEDGDVIAVDTNGLEDEAATDRIWDISITKNVVSLFVSVVLLLLIFGSIARTYSRRAGQAPRGLQNMLEPIILFIRDDVAKSAIGEKKYERFMPFLLTVFFFIFLNNLLGLVPIFPGGANLTGNIAITFILACFTFVVVTLNGNAHYWRHILAMPGVPVWVLVILTPVEILGMFLKPFVLMIRLFANMAAGHIIALSFFSLIFVFGETSAGAGYGVAIGSWAFTVFMGLLELLVAFIQAYVFTFLSAIYIGAAVEEHHEHKESIV
ncbi:MAG: F0F1 ATP synthase subunit A [Flavobacteriales bacterium]|nr:F0F1 ATP synthase subunit A [Flavobacteriales bacterium]MCB9193570.1 F0F1 ATP synthase subunit A [Flavobacteriales bacterium]